MSNRRWLRVLGGCLGAVVALAVTAVVVAAIIAVRVGGDSMAPALHDGDRVLLDPFSGPDDVARFDVVAARFAEGQPLVVKRVIGLPGDEVRIADGVVEVKPPGEGWRRVDHAWPDFGAKPRECCGFDGRSGSITGAAVVPDGMLFLLGDNIGASDDSRAFGWAPRSGVQGVVWVRAWPVGTLPEDFRLS